MKFGLPVICLSFAITACSNDVVLTWEPELPAEKEMRERVERLQSTVGEGSLAGAAGGALLGAALGGAEGAIRGAQIGRLGGVGSGAYVRSLQSRFATKEEALNQAITDVETANIELERSISAMRIVLRERQAALAAIRQTQSRTAIARAEARAERNVVEMNKVVQVAQDQRDQFGAARTLLIEDTPNIAGSDIFDNELKRLELQVKAMRDVAEALAGEI